MQEIRIPRLGWSMEEGTLVRWLKQPGEHVAVGEALFELEGEKAVQEIESVDAGILFLPPNSPQPGSVVPVGAMLGYLLAPGEPVPSAQLPPVVESKPARQPVMEVSSSFAPRKDVAFAERKPTISPRARRVAAELGIDWTTLRGTGREGRVREADVRTAQTSAQQRGDVTPRRRAIAERLRISRDRTIPVTLTTTVDATNLLSLREQFKASPSNTVPAYTDIVACLVARVLKRHPSLAVRWSHDHRSLIPIANDTFHIGIAVDTAAGLLVPVIPQVDRKPLLTVAEESRQLIELARNGRLTSAEMQGGAITISNLGAYGIEAFTPIINYPEIAILGLGAIRREPVVAPDDRIVPGLRLTLSLTFDHAAVDGAPAAAFLRDIATALTNPAVFLLAGEATGMP